MFFLGIDLGGTNIKAGIVDQDCNLVRVGSRPTGVPRSYEEICGDIVALCREMLKQEGLALADVERIGIGCPGWVNDRTGVVEYAYNLQWKDVPLRDCVMSGLDNVPTAVGNDANAAALGEYHAGSAKGADSAVIVTLGTGVGAGIIIDSKIISGYSGGASEFGHMVIEKDGAQCTCGRKGCWEAYSSATGLIAMTRKEMEINSNSLLWPISREEGKVSGKTAFQAMKQGDTSGKEVVDRYIDYLACGLANVINSLQPEIIALGGGISKEGDTLLIPLREAVAKEAFGGSMRTEIRLCTLGNDAGIIGAAMLGA